MCGGGVELTHFDIGDWSVTFVDTALESAIGERLRRVRRHLNGEESSGQLCRRADRRAFGRPDREVVQVRCRGLDDDRSPQSSFYCVEVSETGEVKEITLVSELPLCEPACRLRPRRRRLRHAGRAGQVVRLSARRILEARRHLQGTGRSRLPIPSWRATMDGLGARRRRIYAGRCRRGPMIPLSTGVLTEIAVVAAHCDDIAIRMGGTLLTLCRNGPGLRVRGLVLSGGDTEREAEVPTPRSWFSTYRMDGRRRIGSESRRTSGNFAEHAPRMWCSVPNATTLIKIIGCLPNCCRPSFVITSYWATRSSNGRPTLRARRSFILSNRCCRAEGAPAAQALPVADEPRLVRRASVSRAVPSSRGAVPEPALRSFHCGEGDGDIRAALSAMQ
jgi:hypothetical protein